MDECLKQRTCHVVRKALLNDSRSIVGRVTACDGVATPFTKHQATVLCTLIRLQYAEEPLAERLSVLTPVKQKLNRSHFFVASPASCARSPLDPALAAARRPAAACMAFCLQAWEVGRRRCKVSYQGGKVQVYFWGFQLRRSYY